MVERSALSDFKVLGKVDSGASNTVRGVNCYMIKFSSGLITDLNGRSDIAVVEGGEETGRAHVCSDGGPSDIHHTKRTVPSHNTLASLWPCTLTSLCWSATSTALSQDAGCRPRN